MTYSGGLRHRLIRDSVYKYVVNGLTTLGWFNDEPWHLAITVRPDAVSDNEEIVLNVLALADEGILSIDQELGSYFAEHRWNVYWDFYAESETIGLAVIHDIRDILDGRYPSIGITQAQCPVLDFTQATPSQIFTVDFEDVQVDRAHGFPKEWQRVWFSCNFTIVDYYGSES